MSKIPNINKIFKNKKGYFVDKKLGKGEFGVVYKVCLENNRNCEYALKVQNVNKSRYKDIEKEHELHKLFYKAKLSPKFVESKTIKKNNKYIDYSLIERIDGILEDYIQPFTTKEQLDMIVSSIIRLCNSMCKFKLTHGDMHSGNIAYVLNVHKRRIDFKLIDFGWSMKGKCNPQLELLQFLRTLHMSKYKCPKGLTVKEQRYAKKSYNDNIKYLENSIYNIYKKKYNNSLKNNRRSWQKQHEKLMDEYVEEYDSQ